MTAPSVHVTPSRSKWAVLRAGGHRATGLFPTREEAMARGISLAKSQNATIYVHGKDGRIIERYPNGSPT